MCNICGREGSICPECALQRDLTKIIISWGFKRIAWYEMRNDLKKIMEVDYGNGKRPEPKSTNPAPQETGNSV